MAESEPAQIETEEPPQPSSTLSTSLLEQLQAPLPSDLATPPKLKRSPLLVGKKRCGAKNMASY